MASSTPDTLPDDEHNRYESDGEGPRWPVIRDLMLKLLGRLDAAPSECDKPWWREQF